MTEAAIYFIKRTSKYLCM